MDLLRRSRQVVSYALECVERSGFQGAMRRGLLKPIYTCLIAAITVPAVAQTAPAQSSLSGASSLAKSFSAPPFASQPRLSPDGSRVALLVQRAQGLELVVQPLRSATQSVAPVVSIAPLFGDFVGHDWVSDDRLVVRLRDIATVAGRRINVVELASVNADGSQWQRLRGSMYPTGHPAGSLRRGIEIIHLLPAEPDTVLAALDDTKLSARVGEPDVVRLDVRTGKRRVVLRNEIGVHRWLADSTGVVRVGVKLPTSGQSLQSIVYARASEQQPWTVLQSTGYFERERLVPIAFDPTDDSVLLVAAEAAAQARDQGDRLGVYRFDLASGQVVGPFVDAIEEDVRALARGVSEAPLVSVVSSDRLQNRFVLRLSGPQHPPRYALADRAARSLGLFASAYPQLDGVPLRPMQTLEYTARDGLTIPALLTMPTPSDGPPPLVVLPHGGPWFHDRWDFDPLVQFLASRGYAVLQPQFRGSTGHGWAHLTAGYQQWGLAMQDDISDGVDHLVDRAVVDGQRVCIVGASFGGYAAAIGLAREPGRYRCGVSINGVTDLARLRKDTWSMLFMSINRAVLNDRATFAQTSPYARARDFADPLLLIVGLRDTVVPPAHSQRLYRRLARLGKPVELLELPDGEHWPTHAASQRRTFEALDAFLSRHLVRDGRAIAESGP